MDTTTIIAIIVLVLIFLACKSILALVFSKTEDELYHEAYNRGDSDADKYLD